MILRIFLKGVIMNAGKKLFTQLDGISAVFDIQSILVTAGR